MSDFSKEKEIAIEIAEDLCYPHKVIEKLKEAKDEYEIERILHDARDKKR